MQTEQESSTPVPNQITFGAQSAAWLEGLRTRKRRPVAQSTLDTFSSRVRRLLPIVGADTKLADIHNGFLKNLGDQLVQQKLAAKTITELIGVVKEIVGSAVDAKGERLFPTNWNHEFLDLPTISKQKQPCATKDDVERAIKNATSHQEQLLYAVLSGAGLRIAEALSIHVGGAEDQTGWDAATATIKIRSSIYNGVEQHRVKTQASNRVVDLDPRLNAAIIKFVAEQNIQPGTFLFQSRSGRAMHLRTATARLKKHAIPGFHTFRRHRITRLRDLGTPEDIVRYWVGHAGEGITDRYSKLAENCELRKEWARRAGHGFELDKVGHPAPKLPLHPKAAKPGTRKDPQAEIAVKRSLVRRKPVQNVPDVVDLLTSPRYVASDEDLDPFFATPVSVHEEV
jgi:integrase